MPITPYQPSSTGGQSLQGLVFVDSLSDLPTAVSNVITLAPNTAYWFSGKVDLLGSRLVGSENTTILGGSSENSRLTSTGLGLGLANALFTSEWTTPIRHITFQDVDTAINISGATNAPVALDWTGVNFLNVPNVGKIDTCDNWIYSKGAFLNSKGLEFDGTVGTVGVDNSIFVGDGLAGNGLSITATCTITRRFRIIYSSVVVFGSTVGVDVNTSATVPLEAYILDTVNFSGGGTYTSGVTYQDNKALFVNCIGIPNSSEIASYTMQGNVTATTITTVDTPVKAAGTTVLDSISQKFSHSNNRATFTGAITNLFKVTALASVLSGNNNQIGFYIAKNGTPITTSELYITTNGSGRAENVAIQCITSLSEGDYIEIFVENSTGTSDITVEDLIVTITKV